MNNRCGAIQWIHWLRRNVQMGRRLRGRNPAGRFGKKEVPDCGHRRHFLYEVTEPVVGPLKKNETTTLLFDKFSCFQQKKIEKVNSRVILNDEKSQFEASFSDKVTLLLKTSTLRTSMCFDDRVFYIFLRQAHQAIRTYQCSTWTEQSILRILLRKQPAQRPCHCYRKLGLWGF